MQEEVMRLRESIQVEKEREMANLEQQYYCMRNIRTTPQADETMGYQGECSTSSSSQPFQRPTLPLRPPQPVQTSTPCQGERSSSLSSQPFQCAAQQPPHPSQSAQFSQSNTPSLEAIKRIRILVLDQMVKLKSEVQDDDIQSWKWLQRLIKTLGEHGMSSEESTVENGVENILHRILDTDVFSPQGSKPLTRKRVPDNPSTTHSAAKALPLALYDGAWIVHLTEHEIEALNVPQQTFPWMKVVVA
ncbi:hypothetical protein BKA82DRAFT_4359952 [Pisolithus tinctorius]|nr:hypothetical protein BKA82DRAFT_4359952 [Pisolithus tinctorius]